MTLAVIGSVSLTLVQHFSPYIAQLFSGNERAGINKGSFIMQHKRHLVA